MDIFPVVGSLYNDLLTSGPERQQWLIWSTLLGIRLVLTFSLFLVLIELVDHFAIRARLRALVREAQQRRGEQQLVG